MDKINVLFQKIFYKYKIPKKHTFKKEYFCYVLASQNKNSDFWGIFL